MKKTFVLILLISLSLKSQVNFESGTVFQVLFKAEQENKVVMVDVYTDWCVWCVELDKLVYSKPEVYNYANQNLINYKIDAEKGEGLQFKEKYKVEGYPTILFLRPDGKEIDRIYGYYPAEEFLRLMQDYSHGRNTLADIKERLEKNPKDIEANYRYAEKLLSLNNIDESKNFFNKVISLDPGNKSGREDDAEYMLAELSDKDNIITNLEKFISSNPSSDRIKDAYLSLADKYNSVKGDLQNSEKLYNEILNKWGNDPAVKLAYGRFLNSQARSVGRDENASIADWQKGIELTEKALPYVKGSVSEAASYYWQSVFYFNLNDYNKASELIDKAIEIFDAKLYREHKEKIQKQLSSNN
ncbi:MAG: thioredoxin fold domain-containing protein [Ignavibacteria bacterium]|nr:thioredoxin fold domain-containing protein [Ignavibacteria bacterium]